MKQFFRFSDFWLAAAAGLALAAFALVAGAERPMIADLDIPEMRADVD